LELNLYKAEWAGPITGREECGSATEDSMAMRLKTFFAGISFINVPGIKYIFRYRRSESTVVHFDLIRTGKVMIHDESSAPWG
jgi:hypothetical protein